MHANLQLQAEYMRQLLFERSDAAFERPGSVGKQRGASRWRLAIWNPNTFEAYAVFADPNAGLLICIAVFKLIA